MAPANILFISVVFLGLVTPNGNCAVAEPQMPTGPQPVIGAGGYPKARKAGRECPMVNRFYRKTKGDYSDEG